MMLAVVAVLWTAMSGALSAASTPTPSLARASGFAQRAPTAAAHSSKPAGQVGLGGPGCANQQPNSSQTAATSSSKQHPQQKQSGCVDSNSAVAQPSPVHPLSCPSICCHRRHTRACCLLEKQPDAVDARFPSPIVSSHHPWTSAPPCASGVLRSGASAALVLLSCSARLPSPDLPCPPSQPDAVLLGPWCRVVC